MHGARDGAQVTMGVTPQHIWNMEYGRGNQLEPFYVGTIQILSSNIILHTPPTFLIEKLGRYRGT